MSAGGILRLFLPAALIFGAPALAEPPADELVGTYDGGQTEVGAGLQLGADSRFQYFLSYGAIDEMASGTWAPADDGIMLDSDPVTAPAFELLDSKGGAGSAFDLSLDLPQGMSAQFFEAELWFSDGSAVREEFDEPNLHLKLSNGKSVIGAVLLLPIYLVASERFTVPANTASMRLRFAPNDLGTVDFDRQVLPREGNAFLLSRYDRTLRFVKEGDEDEPVDAPDPVDPITQVAGAWTYSGQDCEPDNHFDPPADMPGASFELSPDYTYRLIRQGKEERGSFTLETSEYLSGDLLLVRFDPAKLLFVFNIDRLESWSEDAVVEQCTQLFERPGRSEQPEE